jgi:hypothetical protein
MSNYHVSRKSLQPSAFAGVLSFCLLLVGCYYGPVGRASWPSGSPVPDDWQKEARYFVPTTGMAPMISANEDFRADFAYSTGNDGAEGYTADMSGRVYKNWAVMGGVKGYSFDDEYNSDFTRWELGAGYLLPLKGIWNFETFAGYGNQKTENQYHSGYTIFNNKYLFIQPTVFMQDKESLFSFGLASRFTFQNHQFSSLYYDAAREAFTNQQVTKLTDNNPIITWEPSLQASVGMKMIKVVAQYSYVVHFNAPDLYGKRDMFSIGVRGAVFHRRTAALKPPQP